MRDVMAVLSGIFMLILVYLFLEHGAQTAAIINAIAKNSIEGIKVLQGRG